MLKSLNVREVYLQCRIVIQRVVTKHGLPSVQLSQMMNLKIKFVKNKCLGTIWSTEMIQFLELIQQESIINTLISCDFTI